MHNSMHAIINKKHIVKENNLGLLNESHPRVFQTNTLSFFIAFKARQG